MIISRIPSRMPDSPFVPLPTTISQVATSLAIRAPTTGGAAVTDDSNRVRATNVPTPHPCTAPEYRRIRVGRSSPVRRSRARLDGEADEITGGLAGKPNRRDRGGAQASRSDVQLGMIGTASDCSQCHPERCWLSFSRPKRALQQLVGSSRCSFALPPGTLRTAPTRARHRPAPGYREPRRKLAGIRVRSA